MTQVPPRSDLGALVGAAGRQVIAAPDEEL